MFYLLFLSQVLDICIWCTYTYIGVRIYVSRCAYKFKYMYMRTLKLLYINFRYVKANTYYIYVLCLDQWIVVFVIYINKKNKENKKMI